jgi:hypothetical protein
MELESKLKMYYITAVFGVFFSLVGFSYNAWRMEVTEDNSNIRTAAFEALTNLAELEQIIYAAHYDQNSVEGSPRKGWVKVGLIVDLSHLIGPDVEAQAIQLQRYWGEHWPQVSDEREVAEAVVGHISRVREQIKAAIRMLD